MTVCEGGVTVSVQLGEEEEKREAAFAPTAPEAFEKVVEKFRGRRPTCQEWQDFCTFLNDRRLALGSLWGQDP